MLKLNLLDPSFNHELEELVKAFYPGKDFREGGLYELRNQKKAARVYTYFFKEDRLLGQSSFEEDISGTKRDLKNKIKKSTYEILEGLVDTELSWGILTGIRPSKLVHSMMDQGWTEEKIKKSLRQDYCLREDKIELIYDIVKRERDFIYPLDKDSYSIYISIPFCPSKCLYCSFPSGDINKYGAYVDQYTSLIVKEIDELARFLDRDKISTIYIGGGTPTAIEPKYLERIIDGLDRNFKREKVKEFTIEAGRPDTLNDDYLKLFRDKAIDRISINPQTMWDPSLELIGRRHKSQDIVDIYKKARSLGDYKINMDLIVGLPSESVKEVEYSMSKIKELDPDNLTVHTLSVKRGSRFKKNLTKYELESQSNLEEMLDITRKYAEEMNLRPYYLYRQKQSLGNFENIGYAKESMECIYNIKMMEERETILAFGLGGVSKIFDPANMSIRRLPNLKSLKDYFERQDEMIEKRKNALLK